MSERSAVGIQLNGCVIQWAELRRTTDRRVEVVRLEQTEAVARPAADETSVAAGPNANSPLHIAALSGPDVLTRCWSLPKTDADRLRQIVALRVEADLPVPADELTWSFRAVGEPSSPGRDQQDVLVQAVRTERMTHQLETLTGAGFGASIVTTEAEAVGALYRCGLQRADSSGTEVLVLASGEEWIVAVITGGMVRSLRRIRADAEHVEQTCRDCQQSIAIVVSLSEVKRILWCASVDLNPAQTHLAEMLGIPVQPAEPSDTLVSGNDERIGTEQLAVYGPAIGLALAGLFERDEFLRFVDPTVVDPAAEVSHLERWLARPWRWAVAAVVLLIFAALMHVGAIHSEARQMRRLLDEAGETRAATGTIEAEVRALQRLDTYRIDIERIVAALCLSTPDSIIISSLSVSREQRLTIKGTAKDSKSIFTLTEALEKESRFAQVNPERTTSGKEKTFTITAELPGVTPLTSVSKRGGAWR